MLRRSTSIAAIAAVLLASCVLFVVDAPEAQAQEPAPHLVSRLTIGDATIVEGSGGTKAGRKLALRLSQPLSFDLTVNYTTDDGTATAPSDYKDKDGKVTIKAGKTIKFLSPKVIGDDVAEGTETFSITLTSATPLIPAIGSVFFAKRQGTVTIIDDDGPAPATPSLFIGDATVVEGDQGPTSAGLSLTLSEPLASDLLVEYATANGSATAPDDFKAKARTLRIRAGKTAQSIVIPKVWGDHQIESDETFDVVINGVNDPNVTVAKSVGMVTIVNDDSDVPAPTNVVATRTCPTCSTMLVQWDPVDVPLPRGYVVELGVLEARTWSAYPLILGPTQTDVVLDVGLQDPRFPVLLVFRVRVVSALGESPPSEPSPPVM